MIRISNNYMIKYFDSKKLARTDEVAGHFDVSLRWLRFATRMIVHEHNCGRSGDQCRSKDFTRVNEQGVEGAYRGQVMAAKSASSVQMKDNEAFYFWIVIRGVHDMSAPVIGDTVRSIA